MNKVDKTIVSVAIIGSLMLLIVCSILPDNDLLFAVKMTAFILFIVFTVVTFCMLSKRVCAMVLAVIWVLLFCMVLNGFWSRYQYNKLNQKLENEYMTYRAETEDFYKDKIVMLKEAGATIELSGYAENVDSLKPYQYIGLGYNLQAVELLKGFVDELQYLMVIRNNQEIDKELLRLEDVKDSYSNVISNPKFDFITYVFDNVGDNVEIPDFSEKMVQFINYDAYKGELYLEEVNLLAKLDKTFNRSLFMIIPLLLLTAFSYILREKWINKEDKR